LKGCVLWLVIFMPFTTAFSSPPEGPVQDGYAFWQAFSREVMKQSGEGKEDATQITNEAVNEGRDVPPAMLKELERLNPWWERLDEIANAPEWKAPPRKDVEPSTVYPYFSGEFKILVLGRTKGYHLIRTGEVAKGADVLLSLNRVGQRVATSGVLIHGLIYQAGRKMSLPVLMNALNELPDEKREAYHHRFVQQYERVPSFKELTEGEQYMFRNGVDMIFSQEGGFEKLPEEAMDRLIVHLRQQGVPEKTLTAIRKEELLSPKQWKMQLLEEVEAFLEMAYNELEDMPTRDFPEHEQQITDRFLKGNEGKDLDVEEMKALGNRYQQALRSPEPSFRELSQLHENVGRDLTRSYMRLMPGSVHDAALQYRAFLALEKLFLIESAQRIYRQRHQRDPEHLQEMVKEGLLKKEMTLDPLTGEPFLKMKRDRVTWYSVGPDLEDNGGSNRLEEQGDWWLEAVPLPE